MALFLKGLVFHILTWGLGALFGGLSPPKSPRDDGTVLGLEYMLICFYFVKHQNRAQLFQRGAKYACRVSRPKFPPWIRHWAGLMLLFNDQWEIFNKRCATSYSLQ